MTRKTFVHWFFALLWIGAIAKTVWDITRPDFDPALRMIITPGVFILVFILTAEVVVGWRHSTWRKR